MITKWYSATHKSFVVNFSMTEVTAPTSQNSIKLLSANLSYKRLNVNTRPDQAKLHECGRCLYPLPNLD
jgi:hypothetical protein